MSKYAVIEPNVPTAEYPVVVRAYTIDGEILEWNTVSAAHAARKLARYQREGYCGKFTKIEYEFYDGWV